MKIFPNPTRTHPSSLKSQLSSVIMAINSQTITGKSKTSNRLVTS
jgi:hypothetical protein